VISVQWRRLQLPLSLTILAILPCALTGCGEKAKAWERVYPADGIVNFKGKPLAGAVVTLVPLDDEFPSSVRPTATSKDDGTFQLGTHSAADGAPAGDYKALVLHFPVVGKKDSPSAGPNDLPVKYAKAETTDLKVTIVAGQTNIPPLELK